MIEFICFTAIALYYFFRDLLPEKKGGKNFVLPVVLLIAGLVTRAVIMLKK